MENIKTILLVCTIGLIIDNNVIYYDFSLNYVYVFLTTLIVITNTIYAQYTWVAIFLIWVSYKSLMVFIIKFMILFQ